MGPLKVDKHMLLEILLRVILICVFMGTENVVPFIRKIHPDEVWLYKNPTTESYFSVWVLWILCTTVPSLVIFMFYVLGKDSVDVIQSVLCYSLIFPLNGTLTNFMKLAVGRPRPDYFYRCFPDEMPEGIAVLDKECTGNHDTILEGRKSFPSGHSSFAFACMGFVALYLAGKLHIYSHRGRGQTWRMVLALTPLVVALMIALSRTCDYHHHWQDVVVGSCLGFIISYKCYFQFYPALTKSNSHKPLAALPVNITYNAPNSPGHEMQPKAVSPGSTETQFNLEMSSIKTL